MRAPQHVHLPNGRGSAPSVAPALGTLRRLPPAGPWLWLVTPGAVEAALLGTLVLLQALPGLLVAFGAEGVGHG